jgi:predicted amidohydrolase
MTIIAIAQFAPTESTGDNVKTIERLVSAAASGGAALIVLPEYAMFTVPAMDQRFVDSAEPLDGQFVNRIREVAEANSIAVVCGMNEKTQDPERISNTLIAVSGTGELVAVYRKLHLYDAFGYMESSLVVPGDVTIPDTFDVDGMHFGMQTCYDLRFPEVTRRIVDAGADVLLLPAEWVPGPLKEMHWTTLVCARAIENTIYVAAADQIAPAGAGNSMIVDPMGVTVAALGEHEGIAFATVSLERIEAVRVKNPALSLRRFAVHALAEEEKITE